MKPKRYEVHEKVWGQEDWLVNKEDYCGKILRLNKGAFCSLHKHEIKRETFYIGHGKVLIAFYGPIPLGVRFVEISQGESIDIPVGTYHSFYGLEQSAIIEISTQHFEDDSYRLFKSGEGSLEDWKKLFEDL